MRPPSRTRALLGSAAGGAASTGLAVGATDRSSGRAPFSNSGQQLSLARRPGRSTRAARAASSARCRRSHRLRGERRLRRARGAAGRRPLRLRRRHELRGARGRRRRRLVWSLKPSLTSAQVAAMLEQTATRPPVRLDAVRRLGRARRAGRRRERGWTHERPTRSSSRSPRARGRGPGQPRRASASTRPGPTARRSSRPRRRRAGSPSGTAGQCRRRRASARCSFTAAAAQRRRAHPRHRHRRRRRGAFSVPRRRLTSRRRPRRRPRSCRREDVGVEAAAVDELVDDPGPRQRLQVEARLAELDADALDLADAEALPDEVVQPHAADDDLPPRLGAGEADVLERLGLDQRQRAARALAARRGSAGRPRARCPRPR